MSSATAPAATAKHTLRQFGLAIRSILPPRRCFFLNQPRFAPVVPVPERIESAGGIHGMAQTIAGVAAFRLMPPLCRLWVSWR